MNYMPTYEEILEGCLKKIHNEIYKGEGSLIYDALSPACLEIAQMYMQLPQLLDLAIPDTTVEHYLDRVVSTYGLVRRQATPSIRKITSDKTIDIGSRWGIDGITYIIVKFINIGNYLSRCEQVGEIGNIYSGEMESLEGINDATVMLKDIVESGQDTETDEALRSRFYDNVQRPATSGNVHHYKIWATEVDGVGEAKVFSLWNGPGTVKVVVTDSNKHPADKGLIDKVFGHIEEVRPIGAIVSVVAPTAKSISINVTLEIGTDVLLDDVEKELRLRIEEYFRSIIFKKSVISYAIVGSLILDIDGVIDYTGLKLNNAISNISLTEEEIPTIGTLTVEV